MTSYTFGGKYIQVYTHYINLKKSIWPHIPGIWPHMIGHPMGVYTEYMTVYDSICQVVRIPDVAMTREKVDWECYMSYREKKITEQSMACYLRSAFTNCITSMSESSFYDSNASETQPWRSSWEAWLATLGPGAKRDPRLYNQAKKQSSWLSSCDQFLAQFLGFWRTEIGFTWNSNIRTKVMKCTLSSCSAPVGRARWAT
jgi:hypothetical protein